MAQYLVDFHSLKAVNDVYALCATHYSLAGDEREEIRLYGSNCMWLKSIETGYPHHPGHDSERMRTYIDWQAHALFVATIERVRAAGWVYDAIRPALASAPLADGLALLSLLDRAATVAQALSRDYDGAMLYAVSRHRHRQHATDLYREAHERASAAMRSFVSLTHELVDLLEKLPDRVTHHTQSPPPAAPEKRRCATRAKDASSRKRRRDTPKCAKPSNNDAPTLSAASADQQAGHPDACPRKE